MQTFTYEQEQALKKSDEEFWKKYDNTTEKANPLTYSHNRKWVNGEVSDNEEDDDGGKLFWIRDRMYHPNMIKYSPRFGISSRFNRPTGFDTVGQYLTWSTLSYIAVLRHYRRFRLCQHRFKAKFEAEIKAQDEMYDLSKAISSDIELPSTKPTFKPRPQQPVAIEFGNKTNGCFIIADQQRTGKSYSALLYALSTNFEKCLIVVPSGVVLNWIAMVETICDIPITVVKPHCSLQKGINIVSYDTLHKVEDLTCDIAIADECHFFVKKDARRSQAIRRIKAPKRVALSGTPILNSIRDMEVVLQWVNPKLATEFEPIINELVHYDEYDQTLILGEELKRRCLLLRESSQISDSAEPYINFIELRDIGDVTNLQSVGRAKINYAVEYCNAIEDKLLIGFYYKETGRLLKARLGDKAVLVDGDNTKAEIAKARKDFESGKYQYFIGSSVISEGLDFSFCNNLLILEESSHSMRVDQLRERCNRMNKEEVVNIDFLIAVGTSDDRLYDILNSKFDRQYGLRDA